MQSPLKYHGGKYYLAPQVCGLIGRCNHSHYADATFGGGSVLWRKSHDNVSECVNDIDGLLTNFWTVVRDNPDQLVSRLMKTPVSEPQFLESKKILERARLDVSFLNPLDRAYHFMVVARQSRQALGKTFTTLSKSRLRRGMQESASSWWTAVESITDVHRRLQGVVIYNKDILDFIREQDSKHTLFYIDPPYVPSTRKAKKCYAYEMSEDKHQQLLALLTGIEGKFILSGYDNPLYAKFVAKNGWKAEIIPIDNKASSKAKKEIKHEYIWYNF